MKKEYNLLTRRLLEMGYTAENYPDYVRLDKEWYRKSEDPLDNFHGGFTFQRCWIYERTFRTPCGLQCKGLRCHAGGLSYMGVDWIFENDMATISCPNDKNNCERKHKLLRGDRDDVLRFWCNVHMVDEKYQYEGSVEQMLKLHDDEIKQKKIGFALQRHGRVCDNHMHFDRDKQEWYMIYDPKVCAGFRCSGDWRNENGECNILGRKLDKKKGNVYYDLKITRRRTDLDGTLFEGQMDTEITRGKRVFNHPVSMDICRNYVKLCSNELMQDIRLEHHSELFFAEYYGIPFKMEVLNIRAEQRESRDLMQDLQDLRDGITISYYADEAKAAKEEKRERRRLAQEKRIEKLEKKILEIGYGNLNPSSLDRIHADKWLGEDRIAELEEMREQSEKEKRKEPVQMSLSDFMEEST